MIQTDYRINSKVHTNLSKMSKKDTNLYIYTFSYAIK